MIQPPDLRQVTVLTKAEWLRIQDSLNHVDKEKQSLREATKQREALYSKSQEVVKQWSNTIAVSCFLMLERLQKVNVLKYSKTLTRFMFTFVKRVKPKSS